VSKDPGKTHVGPDETHVSKPEVPAGPGATHVGPGATSVVQGGSGSEVEQDVARSRSKSAFQIPASLEDQFELVRVLSPGRQAVPLVVRRRDNRQTRVLKLYESGVPKGFQRVLERLASGSAEQDSHLVRIYDFGTYEGDFGEAVWEEQEYCESGSLEELLQEGTLGTDFDFFSEVVKEVSDAISHLHALAPPGGGEWWVHRDIKPGNILIRQRNPLDLVLCDFGLTQVLDQSKVEGSSSGTDIYAAPEVIGAGATSPARDWWALGIMVVEMSTGQHPFRADDGTVFSHFEIRRALVSNSVDVSGIENPRIRELASGLLVRDPDHRWAAAEVDAWLNGESPGVASDDGPGIVLETASAAPRELRSTVPFYFPPNGRTEKEEPFTDPLALAKALAMNWDMASAIVARESSFRQRHQDLRDFIDHSNLSEADKALSLKQLEHDEQQSVHRRLFRLLRIFGPSLPPTYRGKPLARPELAEIARRASQGRTEDQDIIRTLFVDAPMKLIGDHESVADLTELEHQWQQLVKDVEPQIRELSGAIGTADGLPNLNTLLGESVPMCLLLVADEDGRSELRERLRAMRETEAKAVKPWLKVADRALSGS
jgi:serine/threonine protein kinase